ncbi:MAG: SLBB domain-containing protein [Planctomycetes bacterium]|nr:SLBB domain-containing protein [Planctomycetota bacterium]
MKSVVSVAFHPKHDGHRSPSPLRTRAQHAGAAALLLAFAGTLLLVTPVAADPYVVYPGDTLRIRVVSHDELDVTAVVPPDGILTFPLIGKLHVAGQAPEAVEKEVRDKLNADFLVDPAVSVAITAYAKKFVYLLGSIKTPTPHELPSERTLSLMQVISMAGGFASDAARDQVRIFRKKSISSQERITLDVNTLEITEQGLVEKDLAVLPDDVVLVPALKKVYVLGNVNNPGAYDIPSDKKLTVTQAISMAGGFNKVARESKTKILRQKEGGKQEVIVVDISEIVSDGKLDKDVPLLPGDIVYVPESIF